MKLVMPGFQNIKSEPEVVMYWKTNFFMQSFTSF